MKLTTHLQLALGTTQLPVLWVPEALSLGVKWLGHEADHSSPISAEIKECTVLYLHSPNMPSWHGAQLKKKKKKNKNRDNFVYIHRTWRHQEVSLTKDVGTVSCTTSLCTAVQLQVLRCRFPTTAIRSVTTQKTCCDAVVCGSVGGDISVLYYIISTVAFHFQRKHKLNCFY
jgi:hypothetical protein